MNNTVLSLVDYASQFYDVKKLHSERERFAEIVEREIAARKLEINGDVRENDPVDMFLCGRLFLFSAMTGVAPVYEHPYENPVYLSPRKPERLHLLRIKGSQPHLWTDDRLYGVFIECRKGKNIGLPDYRESINELGMTSEVIAFWKHPVTYNAWVGYNGCRVHPSKIKSVKIPPDSRLPRTIKLHRARKNHLDD